MSGAMPTLSGWRVNREWKKPWGRELPHPAMMQAVTAATRRRSMDDMAVGRAEGVGEMFTVLSGTGSP